MFVDVGRWYEKTAEERKGLMKKARFGGLNSAFSVSSAADFALHEKRERKAENLSEPIESAYSSSSSSPSPSSARA